ncbi:F0F1 ATP synthase subunit A [Candidatus Saccharibacteria bacterium]|nr:F0F1 ATP synthase subunit A [Candidatus Saccharibacteria bacterium]MBI3338013.1 F0F1 ATP synthase subunit A [Candidatus Saccharibacteria bacterium]
MFRGFAIEPVIHIKPSLLFTFHGIEVTNSMLYGTISSLLILVVIITFARRITLRPKGGFTQIIEFGTDFITDLLKSAFGSEEKAVKYAPYFVSIFFFLLFSNWLGLLPGVGEAFTLNDSPLARPFTADLNGTLAAALITWIMVQYFAIKESGAASHLRHYFSGSLKNPITLLLGIFEMFSDLTRIASLALRLFLNVAIGEIIIAVFSALGGVAAPITALPFTILELLVGALQAYIFVMLSIMYLAVAVQHGGHDEHEAKVSN